MAEPPDRQLEAPSPTSPAPAPSVLERAARTPAAPEGDQRLANAIRQSFGCSSPEFAQRTDAEKVACAERAQTRAANLPDRSEQVVPPNKAASYDAVKAINHSPGHIPGTDCKFTGSPNIIADIIKPLTCAPLPASPPKPSSVPSLQDLGLAQ